MDYVHLFIEKETFLINTFYQAKNNTELKIPGSHRVL